jgi:hypothetical protein
MDTSEVANLIGTTPRVLRQFLRSPFSTFIAVGSGARYDFTNSEIQTIRIRFDEWRGAGKPKSTELPKPKAPGKSKIDKLREKDQAEWDEEGDIDLPDIRDPRVRERVRRAAQAAEDRLMIQLMAAGLHVSQLGDRIAS